MGIAALVLWILTAGGGFYMLAQWITGGGHRGSSESRFPPPLIFGHFLLAAAGLVLWIIYLVIAQAALGWVALILLGIVAVLGLSMLVLWVPSYRSSHLAAGAGNQPPAQQSGAGAPERRFPVAIVAGHGVLAVATVILVLLDLLGVAGK